MEFLSLENSSLTEEDLLLTEIKQEIDNEVGDLHYYFQFHFLFLQQQWWQQLPVTYE